MSLAANIGLSCKFLATEGIEILEIFSLSSLWLIKVGVAPTAVSKNDRVLLKNEPESYRFLTESATDMLKCLLKMGRRLAQIFNGVYFHGRKNSAGIGNRRID